MALQHLRSSTAHKRPIPTIMSAGQLGLNTNEASPGLFFKDSNGDLVKVGPVHVGTSAPNASPATTAAGSLVAGSTYQILTVGTSDFTLVGASANTIGTIFTATGTTTGDGTVSGQQGNQKGELWLDTTGGTYIFKSYDGTAWRTVEGGTNVAKLDTAQTFTAGQRGQITTLASASTVTPNFADSNNFTLTLGTNVTLANPTNLTAGQSGSIFLVQDGTGSRTLQFGTYWDFAGGTAPAISSAASSVDRLDYIVRSTTSIHAVITTAYS
jgi:hypothetical protein